MDVQQRQYLEEQQRARLRVEQEAQLENERAAKKAVREAAFEQVTDLIMPSRWKVVGICAGIGMTLFVISWLFPENLKPGETPTPIGYPLLFGILLGGGIGQVIVSAATRIKIWCLIADRSPVKLWQFPLIGMGSFPIIGLLFGMAFSFAKIVSAVEWGVAGGIALGALVFYRVTNDAAILMANASLSAADAVNAVRSMRSR